MAHNRGSQHYHNINITDSGRAHLGDLHNYGQSLDDRAFNAILESLSYPGMTDRRDALAEAHEGTFDWTFSKGDTKFVERSYLSNNGKQENSVVHVEMNFSPWLQGDSGGLFGFIGKPGAGKSTLMKSLASNRGVEERLQSWCKTEQLVRAEHYFWTPGEPMQKSFEGLLRDVIHSILCTLSFSDKPDCYARMKNLCGSRWTSMNNRSSWNRQELKLLLVHLTSIPNLRYFFLVDALDECCPQDSHWTLAGEILWMSRLPHVKLCVSFRPWDAFVRKFESAPSLRLDLVTRDDMAKYVEQRLADAEEQCDTRHDFRTKTPPAELLICEVANAAQGVFLWTVLVTDALCSELRKGSSSMQELDEIVSEFPPDLDSYFRALIFDRLGKTRRNVRDTAAALKLALEISQHADMCTFKHFSHKSFMNFWLLSRGHLRRGFSWNDYHSIEQKSTEHMLKETVKFLGETCKDLLVPIKKMGHWNIDFFHRTVYDFLRDNCINLGLAEYAPTHFSEPGFLTELDRLRCICLLQWRRSCHLVSEVFNEILNEYLKLCPCDKCPKWLTVCESLLITQLRACYDCEGMLHFDYGDLVFGCVQAGLSNYLLESLGNLPYLALLRAYEDFGFLHVLLQVPIQPGFRNIYGPSLEVLRSALECGCDPNRSIGRLAYVGDEYLTKPRHRCWRTEWEAWLRGMYFLSQQRDEKTIRSESSLADLALQSCDADAIVDLLLRYGADPNCKPCITDHETLPCADNGSKSVTCSRLTVKELLPAIVSPQALPRLTDLLTACSNVLASSSTGYNQHTRAMRSIVFSEAKLFKYIATGDGRLLWDFQQQKILAMLMNLGRLHDATGCASCSEAYRSYESGSGRDPCLFTWCIDCCGISWLCRKCSEPFYSGTHDLGHPRRASGSYDEADISGHTSITVVWDCFFSEDYGTRSYYSVARAMNILKGWYARNPI